MATDNQLEEIRQRQVRRLQARRQNGESRFGRGEAAADVDYLLAEIDRVKG